MPQDTRQTMLVFCNGQDASEHHDIPYDSRHTLFQRCRPECMLSPYDAIAFTVESSATTKRCHSFPPTSGGSPSRSVNDHTSSAPFARWMSGASSVPRLDPSRRRCVTRRTCRVMGWSGGRTLPLNSFSISWCAASASYERRTLSAFAASARLEPNNGVASAPSPRT